jgi:hypothetical protein
VQGVVGIVDLQMEPMILVPGVEVHVNRAEAAAYGFTPGAIVAQVEQAFNGVVTSKVLEQDRTFDLFLRVNETARADIRTLGEMPLISPEGMVVPLRDLARFIAVQEPYMINRDSGARRAVVQWNTEGRDLDSVVREAQARIKEKVKLALMAKNDPVPSFYDVLWAAGQNKVYFSSLSDKVADDFVDLFKKTFSLGLKRLLPQEHPLALANKTDVNAASDALTFIGREFLTWLWFKSEERNGAIALSKTEEVELHLLKRIALEAGEGEYSQGVVCSGLHAELKEGKEAIRQGKKVKEAVIKLHRDQNEWEFNFKADTFYFQSLKMPVVDWQETPEDPSASLLERIYLIENAVRTIDQIYEFFLTIRLSPEWAGKEKPRLSKWLKKEGE